jgi:hypothetical protein
MVYALLYPHNFENEDLLYRALSPLNIDSDHIILDGKRNRQPEQLIKLMADKLGLRITNMTCPTSEADCTIIFYSDIYEIHENIKGTV